VSEPDIIKNALEAVRGDDPELARDALMLALAEHPERLDLVHTLAIMELQNGSPELALDLAQKAAAVAKERREADDLLLLPQLLLTQGAAHEELRRPDEAMAAYDTVLDQDADHPLAIQGKGHLLLAWGRIDDGVALLQSAVDSGKDDPRFLEATEKLIAGIQKYVSDDLHPRNFVDAHRGSYVEFFNHHAEKTADDGWIAEAARMRKDDAGNLVPVIVEGARPYAGTRVDLVDPQTGQAGLVGDQPMIVAVEGHEIIAQTPILFPWPNVDFPVWGSSQMPWNLMSISIRFESGDADAAADPTIGDWYRAGFDGDFGAQDHGRFHSITDPEPLGDHCVRYQLDCGRTESQAIDDLLKRLGVLHATHPIAAVLIGRGFIPNRA
jgi:tetratricopeptide (TPR) repeat protein